MGVRYGAHVNGERRGVWGGQDGGNALYRAHLGSNGSLALKLGFVSLEGLLSTILELVTCVVFGQSVITTELRTTVGARPDNA